MLGKLPGGSRTGEALAASLAAAIDDGTTVLRGHTGQKSELAHATLLGGLQRSLHKGTSN
jgi:hypothetical protein